MIINKDLQSLTERIKSSHERVEKSAEVMVENMIECGLMMVEAKLLVPKGEWGKYVSDTLGIHRKTAGTYIRFATHADVLRKKKPATIHHARRLLADLGIPAVNDVSEKKAEARRMRKKWMSYQEIADHFEVPKSTVSYWLNAEKLNKNKKKHHAQMQRAKQKMRDDERKRIMKRHSGKTAFDKQMGVAYASVRKALEALQQVQDDNEKSKHTHEMVGKAMATLYRAEDYIIASSREGHKRTAGWNNVLEALT